MLINYFRKLIAIIKSREEENTKLSIIGKIRKAGALYMDELKNRYYLSKSNVGPIMHIALTFVGWPLCYYCGYNRYLPGPYLPEYHKITVPITILIGWITYINAMFSSPKPIKSKLHSLELCKIYPFDEAMFKSKQSCKTCDFIKPARSKHCSVCDSCYEHYDHHCYWINMCVNKHNYFAFLVMVMTHTMICWLACYVFIAV